MTLPQRRGGDEPTTRPANKRRNDAAYLRGEETSVNNRDDIPHD